MYAGRRGANSSKTRYRASTSHSRFGGKTSRLKTGPAENWAAMDIPMELLKAEAAQTWLGPAPFKARTSLAESLQLSLKSVGDLHGNVLGCVIEMLSVFGVRGAPKDFPALGVDHANRKAHMGCDGLRLLHRLVDRADTVAAENVLVGLHQGAVGGPLYGLHPGIERGILLQGHVLDHGLVGAVREIRHLTKNKSVYTQLDRDRPKGVQIQIIVRLYIQLLHRGRNLLAVHQGVIAQEKIFFKNSRDQLAGTDHGRVVPKIHQGDLFNLRGVIVFVQKDHRRRGASDE